MITATATTNRRTEARLRYSWDAHVFFDACRDSTTATMVDLNSQAAALLLDSSRQISPDQRFELAIMYPRITDGEFEIANHRTVGQVTRMDTYNNSLQRVVIRFAQPMSASPAAENEYIVC